MKILKVLFVCSIMFASLFAHKTSLADITITPTRIVFEEGDRFKEVTLVNTSNEAKTYDIGWQHYRMNEDDGTGAGAATTITESPATEFDLSQYVVFTPRRVTLPPSAKQKIRLALRRPAGVADGEYRAHLQFKALRDDINEQNESQEKGASSAAVKINISYSIPVMFRAGSPTLAGKIQNVKLQRNPENGMLEALVTIARGNDPYGVIGHMYIYDPTGKVIGENGNAHVYPEVPSRTFRVPLIDESNLSGRNIRIVLRHYDNDKGLIYDERLVPVQ